jgi:hypothetical protein
MKNKLKKAVSRFRALFPSRLPQGVTEFETWSDSIIELYGAPNNDSVKFSIAVMVLHLPSTTAYKSKEFFGRSLYKAMSNQVVSQVIQDLKTKQEQAKQAEAAASNVQAI